MFEKFISLLLTVLFLINTPSNADTPKPKKLRIGAILSLTGFAANNGESIRKGIVLASDELQAQGWTVEVDVQDDGTTPTKTVAAMQFQLAHGYQTFVGPTWSFLTNAIRPLLDKSEAVAIVPAGSSDINGGSSASVFNLCPRRSGELSKIVEWLKTTQFKKLFIFTPLGDWGIVHRAVFQEAARQVGVEIVGDEQFDYGIEPNALKTILLRVKSKSDLLLTTAGGSDLANIFKFRNELQWNGGILTTEDLWDSIDDGLIAIDSSTLKNAWIVGPPLNIEFSKKFQARFNEGPKMYSDRAYDAVMLLAKATEATDGSAKAIRNYLKTADVYQGVTGQIKFDDRGDRGSEEYKVLEPFNNKSRS